MPLRLADESSLQSWNLEAVECKTSRARRWESLLRYSQVTNFSVHDLALVDSPSIHFSLDTSANGEAYNMIIYGGGKAGLDGVDVSSTNIWIHDIEISNKDEW